MSLSNSRTTDIVQNTLQRLGLSLRNEASKLQQDQNIQAYHPKNQIDYLLTNAQTGKEIQSLEELNHNWQYISYRPKKAGLLVFPLPGNQHDKDALLQSLKIQLKAIARGHTSRQQDYSVRVASTAATQIIINQPVERVYYYGGYRPYRYRSSDFLTDLLLWDMLTHPHYHQHGSYGGGGCCPSSHPSPYQTSGGNSGGSKKSDEGSIVLVIAGIVVVGAALALAAASICYLIGALKTSADELFHLEKLPDNLLKLGATTASGYAGIIGGVALGSTLLLSGGWTVILGLCTMLIGAAIGYLATNVALTGFHMLTNRSSAIDSDPRFQLSFFEKRQLSKAGYDITAVNEAIREVGLLMQKNKSYHINFWSDPNKERGELVTLLRNLKSGHNAQYVTINGKCFDLWNIQEAEPLYVTERPPSYESLVSREMITQIPPPLPSAPPAPKKSAQGTTNTEGLYPPAYDDTYNTNYYQHSK